MNDRSYTSVLGNLMYALVCTRPNIACIVGVLGRYQSNLGNDHWITTKLWDSYRESKHMLVIGELATSR